MTQKGLIDLLKWKISSRPRPWPRWVENTTKPELPQAVEKNEVFITFINHSTLLIQLQGCNILTDPVYAHRVGPFSWLGPRRVRAPGVGPEALPKIDVVLVSHNHYDHMDLPTLQWIDERDAPHFFVPERNGHILQTRGIRRITELQWWEKCSLGNQRSLTLTPAHHWSRRGFFDYGKALWGGFFLSSHDLKLFFAGDTAYHSHFHEIRQRCGSPDVSFLPIGAYEPRWFMQAHHMNPADAIQAHIDLGSSLSVGIHFGTFRLTDEEIGDPIRHLQEGLAQQKIPSEKFIAPDQGQTIIYRLS